MTVIVGVDIGGTKCAVSLARLDDGEVLLLGKRKFPTCAAPEETIVKLIADVEGILKEHEINKPVAIGISCGGPLDSRAGLILSPPNLPGWDGIDIVQPFRSRYEGVPVALQNDANACALAEWKWGAGKGLRNVIYLTFGTGMGAGLILDGRLYEGTNDNAGEVGHMRIAEDGLVGYGKAGSFEGYCSGGGIARLAQSMATKSIARGETTSFCRTLDQIPQITAQLVAEAANQGDPLALEVFQIVGKKLGQGLAILIDVLNPQRIVIGSIYGRQQPLLEPIVMKQLQEEALPHALSVCDIVPAGLGEQVGDYSALSVALYALETQ